MFFATFRRERRRIQADERVKSSERTAKVISTMNWVSCSERTRCGGGEVGGGWEVGGCAVAAGEGAEEAGWEVHVFFLFLLGVRMRVGELGEVVGFVRR